LFSPARIFKNRLKNFKKCRFLFSNTPELNGERLRVSGRWTFKYGSAAVLTAILIIAVSLIANPGLLPEPTLAKVTVMLTDPPTVPVGTTVLNLTYSDLLLHVIYPNDSAEWIPTNASGTVNLFSLINMTQTLAVISIPINSTVDKIQFAVGDVETVVNGTTYDVTALSDTLVIRVADGLVNETLSGVLLDFNPTLVQVQATDANGTLVNHYVLVPSATAVVTKDLNYDQLEVGTIVKIGENQRIRLVEVEEQFKKNVTTVSASLSVNGNTTMLSVTLKNEGDFEFKVFGLTLHGEFNATRTWDRKAWEKHGKGNDQAWNDRYRQTVENIHPETIPFKVDGLSLIPLFGTASERSNDGNQLSSLAVQPGESIALTFSGVIALQPDEDIAENPVMVITPLPGNSYTIRLMGEGFQTYDVIATS
jgi:hypothetical protein